MPIVGNVLELHQGYSMSTTKMTQDFHRLPSVDKLLSDERIREIGGRYSYPIFVDSVRQHLEQLRLSMSRGISCPPYEEIVNSLHSTLRTLGEPSLRPVINATGVILHTNLGRAPLSHEAAQAMKGAAMGYTNLELNLESGKRGSRQTHIESLLCRLTGAEASMVVNNNAAGILLVLSALAKGKEVILSRGQAVEIGDSFRIPDIMRKSGAKLVEVGTTNCTYLSDYEEAIVPRTRFLLRIHSSNFKIVGFTQSVGLNELVNLGKCHNLFVLDDLGSGCLLDTSEFGLDHEPMIQESISAGVGLAFSSADKLLGGPQAGIIVGKKELVERVRKHPLARTARIDKINLAGLTATLLHYLRGEAISKIPVWQMISVPLSEIEVRARQWGTALPHNAYDRGIATVVEGESMVGGGSLPGSSLPTRLLAIRGQSGGEGRFTAQKLAQTLRQQQPPVIGRVEKNLLLLDPRTVFPHEDEALLSALHKSLWQFN